MYYKLNLELLFSFGFKDNEVENPPKLLAVCNLSVKTGGLCESESSLSMLLFRFVGRFSLSFGSFGIVICLSYIINYLKLFKMYVYS